VKVQAYDNFWQNIHRSAKAKGIPLRVMLELTYRCNFSCRHCYVPYSYRKTKELPLKKIFLILDQLKDIGCFYLGFTGGEPFMRKDILQILRYAKKCGFEIIIYSNGSLINERIAKELSQLRPNKVDITIPAINKDNFEAISGLSGSRDKVFKAIELLEKNKVALGFKTCVLKENQNEIKEIKDFAQSLGAFHRLDDMLSRRLDGDAAPYRYRGVLSVVSKKENADCFVVTHRGGASRNDTVDINLFKCGVGVSQAAITPQGELKPCLMIDSPRFKILESSLGQAWQDLKSFISKIKVDTNYKCNRCNLEVYCKWCPGHAWLYNKSFTACVPQDQQKAEILKGG